MKERPILFSGQMVRAILEGRKTQTRRVVKIVGNDDAFVVQDYGDGWWPYRSDDGDTPFKDQNEIPIGCPYGQPGDRLWVRETWCKEHSSEPVQYRADWTGEEIQGQPRWKPSIHMPRWASRITLEITGVRVERLRDICYEDAIAEGMPKLTAANHFDLYVGETPEQADRRSCRPQRLFEATWQSIHGTESWTDNPWVWIIEFKRVQP